MSVSCSGTAQYTGDTGTDIADVAAGGFVAIVYVQAATLGANQCIIVKGSGGAKPSIQIDSAGLFSVVVSRATTNLLANSALTNFATYQPESWMILAGRYNTAGASSAQQIFAARIGQALREPSSYNTQQVGTGAKTTDVGEAITVGNVIAGGRPCVSPIFAAAMFNTYPTYFQINQVARELLVKGRNPIFPASVARAYRFSAGPGTVVGLKSGNALVPSGTITAFYNPPRILQGGLDVQPGINYGLHITTPVVSDTVPVLDRRRRSAAAKFVFDQINPGWL